MIEIRYRAWDIQTESMRDVLVIDWVNKLIDLSGGIIERRPHEVILMQSTGFEDKNGVEIYERDIVRYFRNELAVIVYRNGGVDIRSLSWKECEPLQRRLGEIEVIGNVYQNKDLLGEEE